MYGKLSLEMFSPLGHPEIGCCRGLDYILNVYVSLIMLFMALRLKFRVMLFSHRLRECS